VLKKLENIIHCARCKKVFSISKIFYVCPVCKYCIFDPFMKQTLDFYEKNREILTEYDAVINFSLEYSFEHDIYFEKWNHTPQQYIQYNRVENYVSINFFDNIIRLAKNAISNPIIIMNKNYKRNILKEAIIEIYYEMESEKFTLTLKDGSAIQPISYPLEIEKLLVVYWFFQQFFKK